MASLLHQALEKTARRAPDKAAVIFKKARLTYRQLEEMSTQLAHILRKHNVERGDRVGIWLNRSIEAVVAVFGILKAGAVYVPIDPSAPVRRAAFIIANGSIKALISRQSKLTALRPVLPDPPSIRCVVLTDPEAAATLGAFGQATVVSWPEVLRAPKHRPPAVSLSESDLAYILYTSGSTGEPKGVMISHRAALTFVNWALEHFDVQPEDRLSNHAPLHFDLSIFDMFTSIKAGATVILVPDELSVFPLNLAKFIDDQRLSIWYSVPSMLTQLVLHGDLGRYRFTALRKILFAGEVFPIKYLRHLKACIPHAEYYNLYGPTETNVCTYYAVTDIPPERDTPLPIGKACDHTEVFAVNDRQEVAGPGEIGELYVRGPSLMSGYWGLPEKTREVLLPDPRSPRVREEQVYRTGDLVQQDVDGNYIFLGRRDNMIKSRGYRIELGEIETVLYAHPGVQEVAVIAIPDDQLGHEIKATVVGRETTKLTTRELEYFAAQRLPKYMIPSQIEFCAALPKTGTGKIDKTRLLREHLEGRSG